MDRPRRISLESGFDLSLVDAGRGPAVVLLHGIPGSSASWRGVADQLVDRCRVIVPDLLGFGDSSRSLDIRRLHAEGQAALLFRALRALQIDRAVLVGHDFGGPVALRLLARQPGFVAGLGLLASNTFTDTPVPFPLSLATRPVVGRMARKMLFSRASLGLMLRRGVHTPGVTLDARAHLGDRDQSRAIAAIFEESLLRITELYRPVEQALRTATVPSFVAWGDHDPFFSVAQGQRTAAAIAGSRFELLTGAGHFLPQERPSRVAELIAGLVRDASEVPGPAIN